MKDRAWSLDLKPVYDEPDRWHDGLFYIESTGVLRHIRVALKSGNTEVLTFHAVKPEPAYPGDNDYDFMTLRAIERDDKILDVNPLKQLMADAELGRRVREAGLEFK